jgi:hypothetical protein
MPLLTGSGGGRLGNPARLGWRPENGDQVVGQLALQRQGAGYQKERDAAQFGHQSSLAQQQADAENQRLSSQLGFNREQLAQQGALTRAQIEASLAPTRFAQQKFDAVFPMVQGQLGNLAGQGQSWGGYTGQPAGPRPEISDAPVYNEQQIQQNVNAQRAQTDAGTATQQRAMGNQMASRGFGSNSPLAMALNNSLMQSGMATNTANEQDLRWKAAAGNASQRLDAQKARATQDLGYLGEETKRGTVNRQQQTALISALLGSL